MPLYICQIYRHVTPRVKSNVNYRLWVIMMCQGRFIDCNQFAHLVGYVPNAGDHVCVEADDMRELFILLNFSMQLKPL